LDLTSTLAYGSLAAAANTGAVNSTTTATTTGNIAIDATVNGNSDGMESGSNEIHISRQKYSTAPFTYASAGTNLTSTTTPSIEFTTSDPTSTTSLPAFAVPWGIGIESGQANGSYTGSTTLTAAAD
jgi:hypothetical protein